MKYIVIGKKIEDADYKKLEKFVKAYIKKVVKVNKVSSYADIEKEYIEQKIGNDPCKRARWDIFWGMFRSDPKFKEFILAIYDKGVNDDNLDRYLKTIVAKL
jgi:hypothetical protein